MTPAKTFSLGILVSAGLFLLFGGMSCGKYSGTLMSEVQPNTVEWFQLNVSTATQAEANLLRFPTGEHYMIDAGDANGNLVTQLQHMGIVHLNKIFISHPHKDHYSALVGMVNAGFLIDEVFFNVPIKSLCDTEIPWGCDYTDVTSTIQLLQNHGVTVKTMAAGDVPFSSGDITLRVLYAYDGINTPVGTTDINETSVVMSVTNQSQRILFTGDLGPQLGAYLTGLNDTRLKAQLLKVPHHGTESTTPNSFFAYVNPTAAFVPSPSDLWNSLRSARIKSWFDSAAIPTYVSGITPQIKTTVYSDHYTVGTGSPLYAP